MTSSHAGDGNTTAATNLAFAVSKVGQRVLLAGDGIRRALMQIGKKFDLVVVDSLLLLAVSDPQILAELVDGVILVVSGTSTDSRSVSRFVERLSQVEFNTLGTVLNGADLTEAPAYECGQVAVTGGEPTAARAESRA